MSQRRKRTSSKAYAMDHRNLSPDARLKLLTGSYITIVVGPDDSRQEQFVLPRDLSCHYSPFFSKAFDGLFKEAKDGILRLPEEKPEAFSMVALWLHERKVHIVVPDTKDPARDQMNKYFREMFELYYLVEKLAIEELHDEIMSELVHVWDRATEVIRIDYFWDHVSEIYEKTVKGCPLRRFVIDTIAHIYMWNGSYFMSPEYGRHLREIPDFAADMFLAILAWTDGVCVEDLESIPEVSSSKKAAKYQVLPRNKKLAVA